MRKTGIEILNDKTKKGAFYVLLSEKKEEHNLEDITMIYYPLKKEPYTIEFHRGLGRKKC